ncbi:MAG: AAA family ATPase [Microbacteriaceae bacterium]
MRLAIAVPAPNDSRLAKEAARHGHDVVLRSTGEETLEAAFDVARPTAAAVWSSSQALTRELLAHCDARGIRLLAVVATDADRQHAQGLGIFETVSAGAPWAEVERGLLNRLGDLDVAPDRAVSAGDRFGGGGSGKDETAAGAAAGAAAASPVAQGGVPREGFLSGAAPNGAANNDARTHHGDVNSLQSIYHDRTATDSRGAGSGRPAPGQGTVVAVWGTAGAPGRTSIAIAVAAELAELGYSVALVDADTHSASIAPALGLLDESPGFAAACRLAGAGGLDLTELMRIGQRYDGATSNFWVLTGLGQPSRWPELSANRVATTIAQCRSWVDFTIVDTGFSLDYDEEISSDLHAPRRNAATIATVRDADHILAVGAADPIGLSRFLRTYGDLVETATTSNITVVITKVRASAIGLGPAGQVTQTLARFGGITDPALIPHDQIAMDAALLSGRTLAEVAPRSAIRAAMRQLVQGRLIPSSATVAGPISAAGIVAGGSAGGLTTPARGRAFRLFGRT